MFVQGSRDNIDCDESSARWSGMMKSIWNSFLDLRKSVSLSFHCNLCINSDAEFQFMFFTLALPFHRCRSKEGILDSPEMEMNNDGDAWSNGSSQQRVRQARAMRKILCLLTSNFNFNAFQLGSGEISNETKWRTDQSPKGRTTKFRFHETTEWQQLNSCRDAGECDTQRRSYRSCLSCPEEQ